MKITNLRHIRWGVEAFLVIFILVCRCVPACGEWYARIIYPVVSAILSACVSYIPFSLEEWFVVGIVAVLAVIPVRSRKNGVAWRTILRREAEVLVVVWCWFYMGWGINYFRYDFFTRSGTVRAEYREYDFRRFFSSYVDSLNASYCLCYLPSQREVEEEMKSLFSSIPPRFGLARPLVYQHPKRVVFNNLYSGVGVLGFMGPFFAESQLNSELLPLEYPFTYAHEYSHLLGVSSEAEANFWAYQICTHSTHPAIRYSGYFGLLPYVLSNVYYLLGEDEYKVLAASVRQEVFDDLREKRTHWEALYSPVIGSIQETVYSWYLKGNRIHSAQKNYAEVVGMILSLPEGYNVFELSMSE